MLSGGQTKGEGEKTYGNGKMGGVRVMVVVGYGKRMVQYKKVLD